MAESILRLKVNSEEYDNKLKRAAEGIQRYADGCRKAGGTLEHLDDGVEQFVKELGKMETTSNSARGRINEMTKAFTDLSVEYKHLTDQEKQAPFGNALSESLDQLKGRIIEAKGELDSINNSLSGKQSDGGLFGGDKMSGMLQVFGGNLMTKAFEMASSAALNFVSTIKDAAAQGIEMAKAGEGIRVAFDRLNRPDLLDKLREATHNTVTDLELMKQAVKFNDFRLNLDQMGTLLAFAQQKAKDTGQSVDYMVDSIVTGLGRQSLMILDNLGLSASEIKERMKETGDMTTAVADIIKDQMSKAGDYVETAADRAAKADTDLKNAMEELGRTLLPLEEQGVSMWNSLEIGALKLLNDGVKPLVPVLLNLKDTIGDIAKSVSNSSIWDGYVSALGTVADKAAQAAGPLGKVYMLMKMIAGGSGGNVGEGASVGALGLPDYTVDNIPEIVVTGNLSKKRSKGGSGSDNGPSMLVNSFNTMLAKSMNGSVDLKETKDLLSPYEMMLPEIKKNILDIKDADLGGSLAKLGDKKVTAIMKGWVDGAKETEMAWKSAATAIGTVSSAIMQIQDPGIKIMATIGQAIATVALAYSETLAKDATSKSNIYAFIAAAAAASISMATTIGAIHSSTGYAEGGMIKGDSYSGDNIPADNFVNAGELVLNRAQQNTLAQALKDDQATPRGPIPARVSGENIFFALESYLRRSGKGELLTWQ